VVVVATVACGTGGRPAATATRPSAARAPDWRVRGPGGLEVIEPGTRDPALLDAGACRRCHPAEHAEWAASRHGAAWTNGTFQREYRAQPRRWCVRCHAPTAPQFEQATRGGGPLADQGVSCAACHVRGGTLIARVRRPRSPHATVARADFGGPAFCADCHQFGFPLLEGGEPTGLSPNPMQDTVGEFLRGRFADLADGCRTCHATSAAGHAYPGARDPEMLARALSLSACTRGDQLELAIENRGAGHAVPTGDVHRHILVRAWRSSDPAALFEIFIGRRYEEAPEGGKRTAWDSRVAPGQTRRYATALAALGGEPDEPINVELTYVYTADETPHRRRDPGEPTRAVVSVRRGVPTCPDRESQLRVR
jgi:hypothetical protein